MTRGEELVTSLRTSAWEASLSRVPRDKPKNVCVGGYPLYVALQFRPAWQTCLTRLDQLYVLLFLPMKLRCDRVL